MRKLALLLVGVMLFFTHLSAQTRQITGTVNDASGQPVPNASVRVLGGNIGTITDNNGKFSLTISNNARSLQVTSVGYQTATATIPASGEVTIVLQLGNSSLQEVVVTGYSTRRRDDFTGSSSKVRASEIEQIPVPTFDQILQGRAPGLYVASSSGQPGASAGRVNIRGVGSVNANLDPLYVLDGVPIEAGVFRTLNPNDFESVDVLKDGAATSQYGSRGGNGVIVITSKKGRTGRTQLQYRNLFGFSEPPKLRNIRLMNTQERLQFERELLGPAGSLQVGYTLSPSFPGYDTLTPQQQQRNAQLLDSIGSINTD